MYFHHVCRTGIILFHVLEAAHQYDVQVGHPSGNLQYVFYHHYDGLEHGAPEANHMQMVNLFETLDPYK